MIITIIGILVDGNVDEYKIITNIQWYVMIMVYMNLQKSMYQKILQMISAAQIIAAKAYNDNNIITSQLVNSFGLSSVGIQYIHPGFKCNFCVFIILQKQEWV